MKTLGFIVIIFGALLVFYNGNLLADVGVLMVGFGADRVYK